MARSTLMRVPIAIYLSRVYLLSRRFFRSSRRFSRKAPTFLEKSPTFFNKTRTFSSISQHLRLHIPHCPPLADHTEGRSTANPEHSHSLILKEAKLGFPPLLQNPPFKPCLQNIKSYTLSTEKVNKKADFTLLIHFFAVKPEKRRNFISQTLGFSLTLG